MPGTAPRIQLHLMDPVPGVVVAKLLDGLRELGLHPELLGKHTTGSRLRPDQRRVCLFCRRDGDPHHDDGGAIVTFPSTPLVPRPDPAVVDRVLADVVATLDRLAPAG